ncbi:MAG: NUDIX domain-containing protein [Proteobacteria bacterium]|nr:NUDIX domain-containing protein [Pseudomonadota bacterium]MBU1585712.1 NUDIX domain-containing protein [Pseudomonadota bacterium]MBU2452641.1 NUDIX domain-containing protein [Pseudomonadota bacterium]MBU2629933.1 NUDIX domain-containing protein [Pseudomonadota bacterium]
MTDKTHAPPPLRDASTVILVREKNKAIEVYLLRRSTKSGFMGGLYVFPGGVVDAEDKGFDSWASHIDIPLDQIENQVGGDGFPTEDALGFSIAAIRETLEEAGVFLASGKDKTQKDLEDICSVRLSENLPKSWFKTKITTENWILSLSSLGRWSHWITPGLMKKRFDTRFFIVLMPENQICVPDNMETKHGIWLTPQKALEQNLKALTPLSPPAVVTLTQMMRFKGLDDLKQEIQMRSWADPIAPRLVPSSNGPVILEPWDPMCDDDCDIDTSNFSNRVLSPGAEFSRIWCDKGVWKPVGI